MGTSKPIIPTLNFELFKKQLSEHLVFPPKFGKQEWQDYYVAFKTDKFGRTLEEWCECMFHDWRLEPLDNMLFKKGEVTKDALISSDELHRHYLLRIWDNTKAYVNYIMLNPSTADGINDDPTTRKLIHYTKQEGYGGFIVTNLCSYRTSSPQVLIEANRLEGYVYNDETNHWIKYVANICELHVLAYGNHGDCFIKRVKFVHKVLDKLGKHFYCFAVTKTNQPLHPLHSKKNLRIKSLDSLILK